MKYPMIIKLGVISLVAVLMLVALSMVSSKVYERDNYRSQARAAIINGWSGPQTFVGPVIYASFSKMVDERHFDKNLKEYVVLKKKKTWQRIIIPDRLDIQGRVAMQTRYKGIFEIPVFQSEMALQGTFSALRSFPKAPDSLQLVIAISDVRGLSGKPLIQLNGKAGNFRPGDSERLLGGHLLMDLPVSQLQQVLNFDMKMQLKGVDHLQLVPAARQITTTLSSDWRHPYFQGRYLPESRDVSGQGFTAEWAMSDLSTSIHSSLKSCLAKAGDCASVLQANSFGVGFYEPIDIYQTTHRALKYGFMFILLTFAVFFFYECVRGLSIHPAQYALVGAALALFYLLLISLSEHFGFASAYLLAALSCVALIAGYLRSVLGGSRHAFLLATGLLVLYGMLFFILKSEDYALLMGTSLIFTVLALAMYSTRNLDWTALNRLRAPDQTTGGE